MENQGKKKRLALITYDKIGTKMAGPAIRYFELAKELSPRFELTLFSAYSCDIKNDGFKIETMKSGQPMLGLSSQIKNFDVVLAQNLPPFFLSRIKKLGIKYIADLYDPVLIEVLEYTKGENPKQRNATHDFNFYTTALQLANANHILCASQTQLNYYVGILSGRKILRPDFYDQSNDLSGFITIAPFGLRVEAPKATDENEMYKKFPGIKKGDKIVYWGGGIWNWFDPLAPIKAVEILAAKRNDIKLFFLGVKHPNPRVKAMKAATEAYDYAKKQGLLDKFIFMNFDWMPYNDRTNYLLQSAIGVSTHFNNAETRFSFRTRVLDYLWAELPMILTRGDTFADLCQRKNLGVVVDYENPSEIAEAIEKIVDNRQLSDEMKKNIAETKKGFYWQNIAADIAKIIDDERWIHRPTNRSGFWNLAFDFYLSGLRKKLAK